jgi:hypothetical protein
MKMPEALRMVISYSHKDDALREELETALAPLRRQGLIGVWHDRRIDAGTEWKRAIDTEFEEADVILLLVSPDFVASDFCYDIEMKRAMERHEAGTAKVIPIVVRPVDFRGLPFARLQALPRDAKPVVTWASRDKAWLDVERGIRRVVAGKEAGAVAGSVTGHAGQGEPARARVRSAHGGRGVSVGRDAKGAMIITGDSNRVVMGEGSGRAGDEEDEEGAEE